jgi:D-glycero-alpha-D-manno-heptose 1-phosphate guanylyltransferase
MISEARENNGLSQCPALILVGGMGTRLRPVYADGPKALAPIQGKPFLAYLLKVLADHGLSRVVLCLGHRARQIEQWLAEQTLTNQSFAERGFGLDLCCSYEDEPLGTAGALALAYSRYARGERVLAMNGDSILRLSLAAMWELHARSAAEATIALAHVPDTSRYGSVEVNDQGWVTSFSEKSAERKPGFINGGVYLFEPSVMDRTVVDRMAADRLANDRSVSLEREVLPAQLTRGLLGFRSDGYFIDIGVPQDLARAQSELGAMVGL